MIALIQDLRARLRARRQNDAASYWTAMRGLAAQPEPTGKRAAALLDRAEAAATALGKQPAEVEADLRALRDLAAAEAASAQRDETNSALRTAVKNVAAVDRELAEMQRALQQRREAAVEALHLARVASRRVDEAAELVRKLRGQLAAAGDPAAAEAAAADGAARERERLEAELRVLAADINELERVIKTGNGPLETERARLTWLHAKRSKLQAAIAGDAAPAAESAGDDDDAEDGNAEAEE